MRILIKGFLHERNGATALEYGLIVALIVTGLVVALMLFANQTIGMYDYIITTWQNAVH